LTDIDFSTHYYSQEALNWFCQ